MTLKLTKVNYFKSGNKILQDINIEVKRNDFVTIIGPNGAGKSTLIKIMMGILKPTSGNVAREGKFNNAYLPQRFVVPAIIPIKVIDFLKLGNKIERDEILETLHFLNVEGLENSFMSSLSGGENQKILLARALLRKPDFLYLDEPAQNLDLKGQFKLYELIQKAHEKLNCTIVMISHDLHFVMSSSKFVICIYKHICCQGVPEKITKDSAYNDIFGHEMKQMLAIYNHHNALHEHK